ncbi:MAG: 30S ribosomal protein S6 [Candidatus Woykebacteria bacterium RBG_13_40_7b]|uniref:Small ribosomal subunit protein bS6 n=1 Tax=Candidatus Woykebacteria bacterium RBG_13_40_7b TaxID=1802594 RepID=A0A1G1W9N3_9BACT|nr:MAG: 30S ribosomal protein S6 [Candidatus Woykebacteria bacterium RBG_13_40_7b]
MRQLVLYVILGKIMVREYELVYLVDPALESEKVTNLNEEIKKIIEKDGSIVKFEEWGKKTLSFSVRKANEGLYFFNLFKGDSKILTALNKKLPLEQDLLRYLIVKKE